MAVSRRVLCALCASVVSGTMAPVQAQLNNRSFEMIASPAKATVGDSITLSFRLRLDERDLLTDTVPAPAGELPAGVRLLSVERLRRGGDRVFLGRAVVALYRVGEREIPAFGVPWVQIVTGHHGIATTSPVPVEIVPVLAPGNPSLRDIREPERPRGPGLLMVALGAAGAAAAAVLLARRRSRRDAAPGGAVPAPVAPAAPAGPYAVAVARLEEIAAARLAAEGEVARHYEAVTDVLRDYLEAAEELPARERTTSELLWALPPRVADGGLRRRLQVLLDDADLVKFARLRPGLDSAAGFLGSARELLDRWHAARAPAVEGELDAVR